MMVMMRRSLIFFGTLIVTLFKLCCGVSTPSSLPYPSTSTSFPSSIVRVQASYKQRNSSGQARAQEKLASERQSSNFKQGRDRSEIEGQSSINFPITNYETANYEINHAPSNYEISHAPSNYIEASVTTIDDRGSSVKCNLPTAMYQSPLTQTPMYQTQDSMYQSSPMQIQSPGRPMYSNPTGYQVAAPQQMYQSKARSNELQRPKAQKWRTSGQGSLTNYANQRGGYKIAQNSNQQRQMSSYSSASKLASPKLASPKSASPKLASPLVQGHSPGQLVVMVGGYAPPAPSTAPMQPLVSPCNHQGASHGGGGGNSFGGGGNGRGGGSNYGVPSPPPAPPSGGGYNSRTNVVQQQPCSYQCNQPSVMAPPPAPPPMMMQALMNSNGGGFSPPPACAPPPMSSCGGMTAPPAPSMNYGSPMQSNNGPPSRNQMQPTPTVPRMTPSQGHQQQLYQSTTRGQVPPAGTSSPPPAPPPPPTGNSYPASGQAPAGYNPSSAGSPAAGYNAPSAGSPAAGFRQPRCMCKCEAPPGTSINSQPMMVTPGYRSMGKESSQNNHSPDRSSQEDSGDDPMDNNYSTGGGGSMDDSDPYGIDPSFDDVEEHMENYVFRRSGRQSTNNQTPPTFGQTPPTGGQTPPTFGQAPPLLTNTNSNNSPNTGSYPTPPGGTQHLQQNQMMQLGGVPRQTTGMTPPGGQGRNQVQNQMRSDKNGARNMNQGPRNANQKGANQKSANQKGTNQKGVNFGNAMKLMSQLASPESLFEKLANKQFIIETNDDDLIDGTSDFPFASSSSLSSALSSSSSLSSSMKNPLLKLRKNSLTKSSLSSENGTLKVGTSSLSSEETKDPIQVESDGSARGISSSEASSQKTSPSSTPIPSSSQKEEEDEEEEEDEDVNERALGQPQIFLQPDRLTIEYSI